MDLIEKKLSEMETPQLAKILMAALDMMTEEKQIYFIAKHIDAGVSLSRLHADDPKAFLSEVDTFCSKCLSGVYYIDVEEMEEHFYQNNYG